MAKKMGRPRIEIKKEDFEKLCAMQCTLIEIAGFFDCCEDTVENWCKTTYGETFSDVYKKKSAKGKISLRRSQFKVADSGNASMLIWLGKQYLGQSDKQEVVLSNDDESVVEMEDYFRKKIMEDNE